VPPLAAPVVPQAQPTDRGHYIVEFKQKADANDLAAMSRLDGRVRSSSQINAFAATCRRAQSRSC
jgi:hypothetical protein